MPGLDDLLLSMSADAEGDDLLLSVGDPFAAVTAALPPPASALPASHWPPLTDGGAPVLPAVASLLPQQHLPLSGVQRQHAELALALQQAPHTSAALQRGSPLQRIDSGSLATPVPPPMLMVPQSLPLPLPTPQLQQQPLAAQQQQQPRGTAAEARRPRQPAQRKAPAAGGVRKNGGGGGGAAAGTKRGQVAAPRQRKQPAKAEKHMLLPLTAAVPPLPALPAPQGSAASVLANYIRQQQQALLQQRQAEQLQARQQAQQLQQQQLKARQQLQLQALMEHASAQRQRLAQQRQQQLVQQQQEQLQEQQQTTRRPATRPEPEPAVQWMARDPSRLLPVKRGG